MGHTTERWRRLETLFEQAVAMPDDQRQAFVAARCGGDDALASRLRHMLELDHDDGVLDQSVVPGSIRDGAVATLVGKRVAGYQLVRVIAAGGMGTVYEARQQQPSRLVALKVLSAALASSEARRRFQFEAETLARLNHPAIAAIFESGLYVDDESPHGRPFFAMELVNGRPLAQFVSAHRLDFRRRVELLIRVCEGVEHAHSRGIVHRDLKPANILVIEDDADNTAARPKILDFGIARAMDSPNTAVHQTRAGQILGTLAYMSPEQVTGDSSRVDMRSDVYALGVIAYEILGGRVPHDITTMSAIAAMRVITERDPPLLGASTPRCRGDLETIVAKALERDPDRRYQSATEIAEDLRRHLHDEPIAARRSSRIYQIRKFARRNRALVGGVVGVFVALTLGVIGTGWQWLRAVDQRDRAIAAEGSAVASLGEANTSVYAMHEFAESHLSNIAGAAASRLVLAEQAVQQQLKLPVDSPSGRVGVSYAYQRLGDAMFTVGRASAALESYRASLTLRQQAVDAAPHNALFLRALAVGHFKMFDALFRMGRYEDCERFARRGVASLKDFSTYLGTPVDSYDHGYFSFAHRRLGDAVLAQGRVEESITHYRLSLEHIDPLSLNDPAADRQRARSQALALRGWGDALAAMGDWGQAIEKYEASLTTIESQDRLAGPMNVWERAHRSRLLASLSAAHVKVGRTDEALRSARLAADIAQALADVDRDNVESKFAFGHAMLALAEAESFAGQPFMASAKSAEAILAAVVSLDSTYDTALRNLEAARSLTKSPQ